MNPSPELKPAESPVKPVGLDAALWDDASPEQKLVLTRISRQRARIKARASAKAQAAALRHTQPAQVDGEASLPERLVSFVRLHPIATAAAGALLMAAVKQLSSPFRLTRHELKSDWNALKEKI